MSGIERDFSSTGDNAGRLTKPLRLVSRSAKYIYIALGMLCLGIGAAGTVLPFVPTTPLLLLAAICFGKSSQRLSKWFVSTRFYRSNIDSFVQNRAMTVKKKLKLLLSVTIVMGLSFVVMYIVNAPLAAKIVLTVIWLGHVLYFVFKVRTIRE